MDQALHLQDIEEMRRQAGIDDVELRTGIRDLKAGDLVRVTLTTGAASFETRVVRITSIHGPSFRGKLADRQARQRAWRALERKLLIFTSAHIHSISKSRIKSGQPLASR